MKISDLPHQPTTRDPTIDPETERLRTLNAKQRRDRIAEMTLQGLLAGGANTYDRLTDDSIATMAVDLADALIAELDRI